jgi:hypothetical protein
MTRVYLVKVKQTPITIGVCCFKDGDVKARLPVWFPPGTLFSQEKERAAPFGAALNNQNS